MTTLCAKNLMNRNIISISPTETVLSASKLLSKNNISHLPVMIGKKLVGIISEKDVLRAFAINRNFPNDPKSQRVIDIMTWPVISVSEKMSIDVVIEQMLLQKVTSILIQNKDGTVKGIITSSDILAQYLFHVKKKIAGNEITTQSGV